MNSHSKGSFCQDIRIASNCKCMFFVINLDAEQSFVFFGNSQPHIIQVCRICNSYTDSFVGIHHTIITLVFCIRCICIIFYVFTGNFNRANVCFLRIQRVETNVVFRTGSMVCAQCIKDVGRIAGKQFCKVRLCIIILQFHLLHRQSPQAVSVSSSNIICIFRSFINNTCQLFVLAVQQHEIDIFQFYIGRVDTQAQFISRSKDVFIVSYVMAGHLFPSRFLILIRSEFVLVNGYISIHSFSNYFYIHAGDSGSSTRQKDFQHFFSVFSRSINCETAISFSYSVNCTVSFVRRFYSFLAFFTVEIPIAVFAYIRSLYLAIFCISNSFVFALYAIEIPIAIFADGNLSTVSTSGTRSTSGTVCAVSTILTVYNVE